jgi:hypothetical protein
MDVDIIYNTIKERLNQSSFFEIVRDLDKLLAAGATGGEILSSTGRYLFNLKKNEPFAYKIINEEIAEYLKYCEQSGIIIK